MSDTPETDASVKKVIINGFSPIIEYCYAEDARKIERKLGACQKHNHWFKYQFCEVVDERDRWKKLALVNRGLKHNEASDIAVRLLAERDQARKERDEANQKFLILRECLEYIANAGISARHCEDEARKALALIIQGAPLSVDCPENNLIPACEDCGNELAEDLVCENIFCIPNKSFCDDRGHSTDKTDKPDYSLLLLRELLDAIENFGYGASMMHPRITRAISRAKKHAEKSEDQEPVGPIGENA